MNAHASRYEIDERIGCIAVVDSTLTRSPGLGPGYPGVLAFWHGRPVTLLDRWLVMLRYPGRILDAPDTWSEWMVPSATRRAAEKYLAALVEKADT